MIKTKNLLISVYVFIIQKYWTDEQTIDRQYIFKIKLNLIPNFIIPK